MKREKIYTEEQKEVRRFIKILSGLVIIFAIIYAINVFFVEDNDLKVERSNTKGEISYDSIMLGTLLNKVDDEYYVLAFDSTSVNNTYIINQASNFKSDSKNIPLYTADLSLEFNKGFISDEKNVTDDISNLKLTGTTLIKVKKGHIVSFIDDSNEISKVLK